MFVRRQTFFYARFHWSITLFNNYETVLQPKTKVTRKLLHKLYIVSTNCRLKNFHFSSDWRRFNKQQPPTLLKVSNANFQHKRRQIKKVLRQYFFFFFAFSSSFSQRFFYSNFFLRLARSFGFLHTLFNWKRKTLIWLKFLRLSFFSQLGNFFIFSSKKRLK